MDHPPYLPELAASDIWLFPKLKNFPKGRGFVGIPDIQCYVTFVPGIPGTIFKTVSHELHSFTSRVFRIDSSH
jgi:hypothetical protein